MANIFKSPHDSRGGRRIVSTILNRFFDRENVRRVRFIDKINRILEEDPHPFHSGDLGSKEYTDVYKGVDGEFRRSAYAKVFHFLKRENIASDEEILSVIFGFLPIFFGRDLGASPENRSSNEFCFFHRSDVGGDRHPFGVGTISLRPIPDSSLWRIKTMRKHKNGRDICFLGVGFFDQSRFFHIHSRDQENIDFCYSVFDTIYPNVFEPTKATGTIIQSITGHSTTTSPVIVLPMDQYPDTDTDGFVSEKLLPADAGEFFR